MICGGFGTVLITNLVAFTIGMIAALAIILLAKRKKTQGETQ